jgi:hypothetical protein
MASPWLTGKRDANFDQVVRLQHHSPIHSTGEPGKFGELDERTRRDFTARTDSQSPIGLVRISEKP